MEVVVDDVVSPTFYAEIQVPRSSGPKRITNPREDNEPYILRYGTRLFAAPREITPGTWIKVGGVDYEALSSPKSILWASTVQAMEVEVLPVEVLYPYLCALVAKGDPDPGTHDVPLGMWTPAEETRDHGSFVSYSAYVPADYHSQIDINTEVLLGSKRFTTTRVGLDPSTGVCSLTLRRSGRG